MDIRLAAEAIIKTALLLPRPFGFSYLQMLVRGQRDYLKQPDHEQLETFGALEELNFGLVQDVAYHLLKTGYLEVANPQYGTISASLKGEAFLNESDPMMVEKDHLRMQWYHLLLIGELRLLRNQEALQQQKEVYEIFTNFAMLMIARELPADMAILRRIAGTEKLDQSICEKILDRVATVSVQMKRDEALYGAIGKAHSPGHRKVKEMFEAGIAVAEIARRQNVEPTKIYGYLENLHLAGHLDILPWIETEVDGKILHRSSNYFKQAKSKRLTDAHEVLGIDYPVLRLCRLYAAGEPELQYDKAS